MADSARLSQIRDRVADGCPDQGPCEASVLANVLCELSTARSEDGAARRPQIGHLRQDPSRNREGHAESLSCEMAVRSIAIMKESVS